MSDNSTIRDIFPRLTNGRFASDNPMRRPPAVPDAEGGVAVTRFSGALRRIVGQSSMRQARLRAIRAEIEDGNYETPERIGVTVDRLLQIIS